jgi:DNA-binding MarR family transcriptional regulator
MELKSLPGEACDIGRFMVRHLSFDEWRSLLQSDVPWHQPNVSRAMRVLKENGYIEVRRCEHDERTKEYRLLRRC